MYSELQSWLKSGVAERYHYPIFMENQMNLAITTADREKAIDWKYERKEHKP
jgi:hypothetical protein